MSALHHSSGTVARGVKNQKPPASILLADIRSCEMNRAVIETISIISPEEGTGFRTLSKYRLVIIEMMHVWRDRYCMFHPGVLVFNQERVWITGLYNLKYQSQVTAAFTALLTLK
jgi:hypothetical protein